VVLCQHHATRLMQQQQQQTYRQHRWSEQRTKDPELLMAHQDPLSRGDLSGAPRPGHVISEHVALMAQPWTIMSVHMPARQTHSPGISWKGTADTVRCMLQSSTRTDMSRHTPHQDHPPHASVWRGGQGTWADHSDACSKHAVASRTPRPEPRRPESRRRTHAQDARLVSRARRGAAHITRSSPPPPLVPWVAMAMAPVAMSAIASGVLSSAQALAPPPRLAH